MECRVSVLRSKGAAIESHDDIDALYKAQGGCCAICGEWGEMEGQGGLNVDHCHDTGRIRGMLCKSCNTGLGKFGDSPAGLRAAIAYLKRAA